MKKNFPLMSLQAMAILSMLFLFSCNKEKDRQVVSGMDQPQKAGSSKPGTYSPVPLKMTVNDATGNNITSDGAGDYVNGSQYVSANFDQYGNFIFQCGLGGRGSNTYMVRWINYNFSQPIQIFITPPVSSTEKGLAISTVKSDLVPSLTPMQNMAIGQSQCVGLTTGISGYPWTVNFHRGAEDVSTSPTAYAVFTRISSSQWTVSPAGSCSANSNVCALRNGPGTLYGYYNMPFSFTLTAL